MKYSFKICWLLLFLAPSALFSQTNDFGVWTSVGAEKEIGKWDLGVSTELRTMDNSRQINRWSLQLVAAYNIIKPLKAGVSYEFIYFNDLEYSDYQPRHRYILFLQGKQEIGNFTFSLRERVQRTIKDESDRIIETGKYNNYKINPDYTLRSRLKADYNIPKFPVNPSFSFEAFYQLNNPDGNTFDNLRSILSLNYTLAKQHKFELYGLIDKEINVEDAGTMYVAGLGYTFSF